MAVFDRRLLAYFDDASGEGTLLDQIVQQQSALSEIEELLCRERRSLGVSSQEFEQQPRCRTPWIEKHKAALSIKEKYRHLQASAVQDARGGERDAQFESDNGTEMYDHGDAADGGGGRRFRDDKGGQRRNGRRMQATGGGGGRSGRRSGDRRSSVASSLSADGTSMSGGGDDMSNIRADGIVVPRVGPVSCGGGGSYGSGSGCHGGWSLQQPVTSSGHGRSGAYPVVGGGGSPNVDAEDERVYVPGATWVQIDTVFGLPRSRSMGQVGRYVVRAGWFHRGSSGQHRGSLRGQREDDQSQVTGVKQGQLPPATATEICVVRQQLKLDAQPGARFVVITVTRIDPDNHDVGNCKLDVLDASNRDVQPHRLVNSCGDATDVTLTVRLSMPGGPRPSVIGAAAMATTSAAAAAAMSSQPVRGGSSASRQTSAQSSPRCDRTRDRDRHAIRRSDSNLSTRQQDSTVGSLVPGIDHVSNRNSTTSAGSKTACDGGVRTPRAVVPEEAAGTPRTKVVSTRASMAVCQDPAAAPAASDRRLSGARSAEGGASGAGSFDSSSPPAGSSTIGHRNVEKAREETVVAPPIASTESNSSASAKARSSARGTTAANAGVVAAGGAAVVAGAAVASVAAANISSLSGKIPVEQCASPGAHSATNETAEIEDEDEEEEEEELEEDEEEEKVVSDAD
eukprot:TRINITY_DN74923_c0_g1_i1.p1 TRINITY_DN74923_c0_g1~~TRINITY_DN74923_c0_g1_i1.p1  ORF type:complete len:695 (-),score=118.55 TRINITY_DN74923_c0_g1_i1:38-2083(-)